jgi:hypothetical protein
MEEKEIKIITDDAGNKIGEAEYLDGKLHGVNRLWSSNGHLILHAHFYRGEYHGLYQTGKIGTVLIKIVNCLPE